MKRLLITSIFVSAIVAACSIGIPKPHPQPPAPAMACFAPHVHPAGIYDVTIGNDPPIRTNVDGYTYTILPVGTYIIKVDGPNYVQYIHEYTLTTIADGKCDYDIDMVLVRPFPAEHGHLTIRDGAFYDEDGKVWQWKGFSDFLLYQRFLAGEDIGLLLRERIAVGANTLRVLGMIDSFSHFRPQEHPDYYTRLPEFAALLANQGLRLEFVIFADAQTIMPNLIDDRLHMDHVVNAFNGAWNVFIEIANEPYKNMTGGDLMASSFAELAQNRGLLISAGEVSQQQYPTFVPQSDYGTIHSERKAEWPRTSKDLLDLRNAVRIPWVADEPMGAAEADQPGKRSNNASDFRYFAATAALEGAGATFHSDAGIGSGLMGISQQFECAKAFFQGLGWVPAEAQLWPYQRGDQGSEAGVGNMPIMHDDNIELRSFCKSDDHFAYCVQIRTSRQHAVPRDGWQVVSEPWQGFVYLAR